MYNASTNNCYFYRITISTAYSVVAKTAPGPRIFPETHLFRSIITAFSTAHTSAPSSRIEWLICQVYHSLNSSTYSEQTNISRALSLGTASLRRIEQIYTQMFRAQIVDSPFINFGASYEQRHDLNASPILRARAMRPSRPIHLRRDHIKCAASSHRNLCSNRTRQDIFFFYGLFMHHTAAVAVAAAHTQSHIHISGIPGIGFARSPRSHKFAIHTWQTSALFCVNTLGAQGPNLLLDFACRHSRFLSKTTKHQLGIVLYTYIFAQCRGLVRCCVQCSASFAHRSISENMAIISQTIHLLSNHLHYTK